MSDTEAHKGTLYKYSRGNESLFDAISRYAESKSIEFDGTDPAEIIGDHFYDELIIVNGQLYTITDSEYDTGNDIYQATMNADASISYVVQFYNGGCSFSEALQSAVSELKPQPEQTEPTTQQEHWKQLAQLQIENPELEVCFFVPSDETADSSVYTKHTIRESKVEWLHACDVGDENVYGLDDIVDRLIVNNMMPENLTTEEEIEFAKSKSKQYIVVYTTCFGAA